MKKYLHFLLMALLMGGLSMSVTSCKDDDKDDGGGGNGEEISPTETDEADMAAHWLLNLTNMDEFTDDWASKTYEPTIGEPSKNQSTTRVVCVADLDYAKMSFSGITGIETSKLSTTQTQTIEGIGSLTWTPSPAGAENLAVVEVNTKLIPHLSRIVYCTKDQLDDNANPFSGTAFYRFGDVIRDTQGYYWVCVKPPFGTGEGAQQEGVWINIINRDPVTGKYGNEKTPEIPDGLVEKSYNNKYNGNTILLPTGKKCDKTQVHYLSNLIWALLDPDAYEKATGGKGTGLGGYEYQYNGAKFAKRVAEQWTKNQIWEKLFNRSYEQMKQFKNLNFYYWGYSFWPKTGSKGGFWVQSTSKFTRDCGTRDADHVQYELKESGKGFDIRRYMSDPDQNPKTASNGTGKNGYAPATQFTSTDGYWYVRYKTSTKLVDGWVHPTVYKNLENMANVYLYNAAYNEVAGNANPVETESDIPAIIEHNKVAVGNLLGQDGHFYATAKDAKGMGTEPVAIVAWLAGKDYVDQKSTGFNGLCIALKRLDAKSKWITKLTKDSCDLYVLKNYTSEPKNYDGYTMSNEMLRCEGHEHPAAYAALTNKALTITETNNFSKWFLPSVGQFVKALESLGGWTWNSTNGFGSSSQKDSKMAQLRKKFEAAGVDTEFDFLVREEPRFWTTTLIDERNSNKEWTKACTFKFQYFLSSGEDLKTYAEDVTSSYYVLPFIAFKYEVK